MNTMKKKEIHRNERYKKSNQIYKIQCSITVNRNRHSIVTKLTQSWIWGAVVFVLLPLRPIIITIYLGSQLQSMITQPRSHVYVAAVWRNNKRKLQQCCLGAVFFITIPKLDDDDTDISDENELSCLFPLLMLMKHCPICLLCVMVYVCKNIVIIIGLQQQKSSA